MSFQKTVWTNLWRGWCILMLLFIGLMGIVNYYMNYGLWWVVYVFGIIAYSRNLYITYTGDYMHEDVLNVRVRLDDEPYKEYRVFYRAPGKMHIGVNLWWETAFAFVMPFVILLIFIR